MTKKIYSLPITLQKLLDSYVKNGNSFICYAAEGIVSATLAENQFGYIDSNFFLGELHRLDPELFSNPSDVNPGQVVEKWFNPDCLKNFPFIYSHCKEPLVSGAIRAFRIALLALLIDRHGPDTTITFKFSTR
jgi:hypothetical protein